MWMISRLKTLKGNSNRWWINTQLAEVVDSLANSNKLIQCKKQDEMCSLSDLAGRVAVFRVMPRQQIHKSLS